MKKVILLLGAALACTVGNARDIHVSKQGDDSASGAADKPFKTISAAAEIAQPGDVITVHEGVYRERVNPPRGGTSDEKRITYQAAPGEKVVIKGSEVVTGWEKVKNDAWKVALPNSFFDDLNPYSDVISGEWYKTPKNKGFDHLTGAVYLNGEWLDEAGTLEQVLAPTGERPCWKAEVDENTTTIRAQFKGVDPNRELVEINVRQSVFYPDEPGRNYITVRGFTMRQAATPWSGAMSEQIGLIGTHWSKGWIIEDNVISHSMNAGITLGRYDLAKHGAAMPEVSAPGFVKSCELALEHGWSREKVGSHVVRNNHISHCEKNGIHGSLGGIFSTIEGNTICDIAVRGWISGADVAGLKLLASNDVIIRDNHIYRCKGYGGIWLDWMAQGTRVTGNLLHDNSKDLFMEVDHGPFLIDNNLFLSGDSIQDWSQGAAYAHNLIAGRITSRQEDRITPYFKPHTVEGMKVSSIKHKDARYYNNLLIGKSRLPQGKPVRNLEAAGNVNVQASGIRLEEKSGGLWIRVPQVPAAQKRSVVTSELLGRAKVPDASFEKPDGTPYRLDTDYFGKKRNTENPAPGPFAAQTGKELQLKVWPQRYTSVKPNILIVLTDDLGYGDISLMNPESKVQTPHMDALAKEGVWGTDAHAPSTVCSPSRYAMLTGRYAWRHNKMRAGRLNPWEESAIDKDRVTLPKMLKTKGYFTACIGKWHLGFDWPWKGGEKPPASFLGGGTSKATCDLFDWSRPIKGGPLGAGFDYYFGDDVPNMPPYAFIENDRLTCDPVDVNGRALMKQQTMNGGYIHGVGPGEKGWQLGKVMPAITAKAVETIHKRSRTSEPFFMMFATTSPHSPIVPQEKFQGVSKAGPYGDYVVQTDDAVGQIVAALKDAGVYENTLLVISSDNGPAPFMRERIRSHQHNPSGPLRGLKRDLLEGGHRVPFIASWPQGGVSGGRRIDATLSLADLFATIAGIVGVPLEEGVAEDSLDILPTLRSGEPCRKELVYHAANGKLGLRQGEWVYLCSGGITPEPEWYQEIWKGDTINVPGLLFDLSSDLGERINLYDQFPERVKRMEAKLSKVQKGKATR